MQQTWQPWADEPSAPAGRDGLHTNRRVCRSGYEFALSAPRGGEGWGEAGGSGGTHLTLPIAFATGPLPLPPEAGGEGKSAHG